MALPVNAQIRAARSFVVSMQNTYSFLLTQDASPADERYSSLLRNLDKARDRLKWNPASGRPARLLNLRSIQGKDAASHAIQLATSLQLPELRELILKPYVLLYAHDQHQVYLISIRHKRQLLIELD